MVLEAFEPVPPLTDDASELVPPLADEAVEPVLPLNGEATKDDELDPPHAFGEAPVELSLLPMYPYHTVIHI